jgi:amino acid adenylation domain-containing protein
VTTNLRRSFTLSGKNRAVFRALLERNGLSLKETAIARRSSADRTPCSFAQQRLWFLDRLNPDQCLYNIPAAVRLENALDALCLEESVNELVGRHESLRTTFREIDGEPVQVIAAHSRLKIAVTDVRDLGGENAEVEVVRVATREARTPFDLQQGPLLRVGLVLLPDAKQVLLVTMHHIISDGWSMEIFFRELTLVYRARFHGESSCLTELPVQYADYAAWQREWLQGEALERELRYWRHQLAGMESLRLPTDRSRPVLPSYRGSRELVRIDEPVTAALKELCRQENATLFMALLAAFQLLLGRYSGQQDIAVGTLTAGRNRVETEGLIGFFVNTLVLRTDLGGNPTFRQLLHRVRDTALATFSHAELPFEKLVEQLQPQRDLSRNPLIQVTFQIYNPHYNGQKTTTDSASHEEASRPFLDVIKETAKFDLALEMWERGLALEGRLEYSTDLFDAATIRRMLQCLVRLLHQAVAHPDGCVGEFHLLSEKEEREQIIVWNATDTDLPFDRSLHTLFEEQSAKTPDATAVICENVRWTYKELDRRANQIAFHLRARGLKTEARVGVCLYRSPQLIAALLGVLKAGAAYVPLDPGYPPERIQFMLSDSECAMVISDLPSLDMPFYYNAQVIRISEIQSEAESLAEIHVAPEQLAYVLYTSGSTGRPKGVALEHRNALVLVCWAKEFYPAEDLCYVLASTSVCFDLSVFEIFVPLCCGGTIVLVDSPLELHRAPARDQVTLINTVPSAISELVTAGHVPNSVRTVNLAGEPLRAEIVEGIFRGTGAVHVYNLYGPTEDATYATCAEISRGQAWSPTIGRPIANHKAYILDSRLQPLPIGVAGELYLGGRGVARSYLNRPQLSAEKFLSSPFESGTRLYRTGDLARFRQNGEIKFLGRSDHQVKLRGYRIELGEIEAALRSHPAIEDAVVILREAAATGAMLSAYAVARPGLRLEQSEIFDFLKRKLPTYMTPSTLALLDRMPLTPNGKTDRNALQAIDLSTPPSRHTDLPRTRSERSILAIWKDVLGRSDVSLHDNFFELGGHSLLLLRLQTRLTAIAGEVPLVDLFRYPTVAALAKHLTNGAAQEAASLSTAQQRARRQNERIRERERVPGPQ